METNWKTIVRDVAFIWILTYLGGFVVGLVASKMNVSLLMIAISNLVFGTLGFVIAGCLTTVDRFKHLLKVAVGVWVVGLVYVILVGMTIIQWILSAVWIALMMAVGGGLSFLLVKPPKASA